MQKNQNISTSSSREKFQTNGQTDKWTNRRACPRNFTSWVQKIIGKKCLKFSEYPQKTKKIKNLLLDHDAAI